MNCKIQDPEVSFASLYHTENKKSTSDENKQENETKTQLQQINANNMPHTANYYTGWGLSVICRFPT